MKNKEHNIFWHVSRFKRMNRAVQVLSDALRTTKPFTNCTQKEWDKLSQTDRLVKLEWWVRSELYGAMDLTPDASVPLNTVGTND